IDSNVVRTSYQTPAASLFRLQSPEIPQPLPAGPAPKIGNAAASPVSRSSSGFATGASSPEPPIGGFASESNKPDAPFEAVPAPQHTFEPEPTSGVVNNPCTSCDGGPRNSICCDSCRDPDRFYFSGEYLLWWIKDRHVPPLVTTGPVGSTGVLGAPG